MFSALALAAWCTAIPLREDCSPLRIVAPHGTLRLAVASDVDQRERGLMWVKHVPHAQGMIFVFPDGDRARDFWMKNTIAPLDMIFVAGDGTVTSVARDVPATTTGQSDNEVPRRSGNGTYVIELAAGDAAREGIVTGTHLTIPSIPSR